MTVGDFSRLYYGRRNETCPQADSARKKGVEIKNILDECSFRDSLMIDVRIKSQKSAIKETVTACVKSTGIQLTNKTILVYSSELIIYYFNQIMFLFF